RLLSAQQFERASKLILACDFIRSNYNDLGNERISIGFWVGSQTIPNYIKDAKRKLERTQQKLNEHNNFVTNPFQLSTCQWCNSKVISRLKEDDDTYQIGHRVNRHLNSYCLNPSCHFS